MAIKIIGGSSYDNGGDGIRIEGDLDVHIESVDTHGNGGQGVNVVGHDEHPLDEETKQLLVELKDALASNNKPIVKRVLNTLTDKGLNLIVALVAGKFFS